MQECTTQIQYLKQVQQPSVAQLRSTVEPAINLSLLKMKSELEQTKDKLEQAQNELSAWKFTPDSKCKCKDEICIAFNLERSDLETPYTSFANKTVDFVIVVELLSHTQMR
ncbi:hypothetical protein MG293_003265 [Ovis ammon polii]|uniref:Pre-mRNA-splicing regulator WTAP n=1 Tax=Ovis ammon polii TaxID=230172 RepID=A0AAD4UN95_OVIAM|nr:hypothetical protein MG293_003265 [Ovis ammon polii]KAI4576917.1 hypothetical protein MJT46_002752 [Ovis ammon polii x Ovis aries]